MFLAPALAILDKKERVLTAQQNNNFEKLVRMLATTSNMGNLNNLVSNTQNSNVTYQLGDIVIKTNKDGVTFGREFFNELKAMI